MTDSESDAFKASATTQGEHETKTKKKEMRTKLRDQMEFYFSDSNLTKDRFLRKEIENSSDGYINLNVFLKFNKIRTLTEDTRAIVKSLKHSDTLELNDQLTMVRRRTPFVEPSQKEIDKKTIYVENLPEKTSNESIKEHFGQFGKVCYISMPKFKTSNESKGFAFIEFEDKAAVKIALEHFDKLSGGRVYDYSSIGKFPKFNAQIVTLEKKIANVNQEIADLEANKDEKKDALEKSQPKHEKKEKNSGNKEEKMEIDEPSDQKEDWKNLKVIPKKAWLRLKEDFLNRQKQEISELKQKLAGLEKKLDDLKSEIEKKSKKTSKCVERGCIVKMILSVNNEDHLKLLKMTRQQFKDAMLKDYLDHVAYVDVEKSLNRVLVRCKTPEAAKALISHESVLVGFDKCLLEGQQEEEYFSKIDSSRNKKVEKKEKKAQRSNPKNEDNSNKWSNPNKQIESKSLETRKKDTENDLIEESKSKRIKITSGEPHEQSNKHIVFDND